MKVLGVGLSRTGTLSLHSALEILGLKSLHYDTVRLNDVLDGSNPRPDFRRYDDLDALLDLPTAYFYDELMLAYPECKCVLTVRDLDSWWRSVSRHFNEHHPAQPPGYGLKRRIKRYLTPGKASDQHVARDYNRFRIQLRNVVYGSTIAHEFIYKKKYLEHNQRARNNIPPERLLVMDITAGDGWDKLCPFLELPRPSVQFPHKHGTGG